MKFVPYENLRDYGIVAHPATLWRWEKAKPSRFPKRVQVSPGRIAWVESEIQQWVKDRIAARDAVQAAA